MMFSLGNLIVELVSGLGEHLVTVLDLIRFLCQLILSSHYGPIAVLLGGQLLKNGTIIDGRAPKLVFCGISRVLLKLTLYLLQLTMASIYRGLFWDHTSGYLPREQV
jgi:hypothetical protein